MLSNAMIRHQRSLRARAIRIAADSLPSSRCAKPKACGDPRQLLRALEKSLVPLAIGAIGAREHNVLPDVGRKSGWGDRSHSPDDLARDLWISRYPSA